MYIRFGAIRAYQPFSRQQASADAYSREGGLQYHIALKPDTQADKGFLIHLRFQPPFNTMQGATLDAYGGVKPVYSKKHAWSKPELSYYSVEFPVSVSNTAAEYVVQLIESAGAELTRDIQTLALRFQQYLARGVQPYVSCV